MKEKVVSKIVLFGKEHQILRYPIIAVLAIVLFFFHAAELLRKKKKRIRQKKKTQQIQYRRKYVQKMAFAVLVFIATVFMEPHIWAFADYSNLGLYSKPTKTELEKAETAAATGGAIGGRNILYEIEADINARAEAAAAVEEEAKRKERELELDTVYPWYLLLVNEESPLPKDFHVELERYQGRYYVDKRILPSLQKMLDDAKLAGMSCIICSAYRDYEKQEKLFQEDVKQLMKKGYCYDEASEIVMKETASPGMSEHQTGLAVDIVGAAYQVLDAKQAETKEAIWLKENCSKYGFILRYTEGKEDVTQKSFESWHFRYVGVEAATCIMENNITLEEYLKRF